MEAPSGSPDDSPLQPDPADSLSCPDSYVNPTWILTVIPPYIYVISALGILLNLMVLLVFLLHKKACTATEIYLSNMAAADLCLTTFLPIWGKNISNGFLWAFGEPMCKTVSLLITLNYNCSIYFLVLVCVDRFLALVHPLSQSKLHRRKYAKMCSAAVWCGGLLLNIPTLVCRQTELIPPELLDNQTEGRRCVWKCESEVYHANEIFQIVVMFFLPLLIISFCTFKILMALKERPTQHMSSQNGERKVTVLVLAVLLVFLFCWLPSRVLKIIDLAMSMKSIAESCELVLATEVCQHVFLYLAFFNSDLNPVLYVFVGKNFRRKMMEVLSGQSLRSKPREQVTNTTNSSSLLTSVKLQANANDVK